jgi:2-polyprenyl-3-methyl-5-hydroxy-6-metoxy-1,4-benzoquinol methylase
MFVDTTYRSKEIEIMDDLDMSGEALIKTLNQIASINKWLGGNGLTIDGIKSLLKSENKDKLIRIVDLGCGNGDMLREVAVFGKKNGYQLELIGIDANLATIDYAIQLSVDYPEIKYRKQDVLAKEFETQTYDIVLCTLFLHHFEDAVALDLIQSLLKNTKIGIVVNDLHRHRLAYYLFKIVTLFINNDMVKTDGLISILRGFKRKDLKRLSKKINYKSTITWRWAFRYQWIINKK